MTVPTTKNDMKEKNEIEGNDVEKPDDESLGDASCSGLLRQLERLAEILEPHGVQILRIDQAHHHPALPEDWRDISGNPVEGQDGYAAKIEILISSGV